jgi:hypothetical protein
MLPKLQGMQLFDSSIDSKTPSNLLDLTTGNPRISNAKNSHRFTIFHKAIPEFSSRNLVEKRPGVAPNFALRKRYVSI